MLDIKFLLNNYHLLYKKLGNYITKLDFKKLNYLYNKNKYLKFEIELLKSKHNFFTKKFFSSKNKKIFFLKKNIKFFKVNIIFRKKILDRNLLFLRKIIFSIPNIPYKDVPIGNKDNYNVIIYN